MNCGNCLLERVVIQPLDKDGKCPVCDRETFKPSKNCAACKLGREHTKEQHEALIRRERNAARRARHQAFTDCGLKRVKGALGGTYYE
jgi:hypothetical protein